MSVKIYKLNRAYDLRRRERARLLRGHNDRGGTNMIELTSVMTIRAVALKAKTKDGVTVRRIRMTVEREFDDDMAASLGADATRIRKLLSDGAMAKAEIPLDAIEAEMRIKNVESSSLKIAAVKGVRAVAKAPPSVGGEMPPSIALMWDFAFADDVVVFLANSLGQTVSVDITPRQLELIKAEKERSPFVRAAAAQASGTLTRELVAECERWAAQRNEKIPVEVRAGIARYKLLDAQPLMPASDGAPLPNPVLTPEVAAALEDDDVANAATPEQAEENRAARLAAEAAERKADEADRYTPEMIATADEADPRFTFTDVEDDKGPYVVARFESTTHILEAEADDRQLARAALRIKLLDTLAVDAAAGAPKRGLVAPAGAKAKTHKSTRTT